MRVYNLCTHGTFQRSRFSALRGLGFVVELNSPIPVIRTQDLGVSLLGAEVIDAPGSWSFVVISDSRFVSRRGSDCRSQRGVVRAERDAVLLGAHDLAERREGLGGEVLGRERDARRRRAGGSVPRGPGARLRTEGRTASRGAGREGTARATIGPGAARARRERERATDREARRGCHPSVRRGRARAR